MDCFKANEKNQSTYKLIGKSNKSKVYKLIVQKLYMYYDGKNYARLLIAKMKTETQRYQIYSNWFGCLQENRIDISFHLNRIDLIYPMFFKGINILIFGMK